MQTDRERRGERERNREREEWISEREVAADMIRLNVCAGGEREGAWEGGSHAGASREAAKGKFPKKIPKFCLKNAFVFINRHHPAFCQAVIKQSQR